MLIEDLIIELSNDPFNPEKNFAAAVEYEKNNQTASAVSFYLRSAEYGFETHRDIVYTSLLKMAKCFNDQKGREHSVTKSLLQALQYNPDRPEAYFFMSNYYESIAEWQECYTWAELGLNKINNSFDELPADVDYSGEYCLIFEKAVSGWWIGRKEESIILFNNLLDNYDMKEDYVQACINNLNSILN